MPLQPTVLWAQRADRLLLTIDLQACKDPQISITNDEAAKAGKLSFRGHAHSHATGPEEHAYQLDLEFYGEIDESDIKQLTTDRYITLAIAKKGEQDGHWPRLLKTPGKTAPNIKVDWDKWVDEDDEAEGGGDDAGGMGGFDMSQFSQMQNMGAMGGMGGGMGGMMGGMPGMGGMGGGAGGMAGMAEMLAGMGGGAGGMGGFGGNMSDDEEDGEGGAGGKDGGDSDDDLPDLEPVPQA